MRRFDLSLRTRIAVLLAVLLGLGATVVGVVLPLRLHGDASRWAEDRAHSLAEVVAAASAPGLDFGDTEFVERRLELLEASPDARWAVVLGADGTPLARWARPGVAADDVRVTGVAARQVAHELRVETPLAAKGGATGTLVAGFGTDALDEEWRASLRLAVLLLGALVAASVALGWVAGTVIAGPLRVLTLRSKVLGDDPRAFTAITDEDRYPWRNDEAMVLTQAFSAMARRIARQLDEIDAERGRAVEAEMDAIRASGAKSLFLANMSHELRTPLNAIIGYCEILAEEEELDPAAIRRDLDRVLRASRHLLSLINDVLDLSKIEADKLELEVATFGLRELVQDLAASMRPLADARRNRLWVSIGEGIDAMRSDPVRVRQCLFNLLSNAVKFTSDGEIGVRVTREGDLVRFDVSDSGIGMDDDQLGSLFQPFVQADASTTRRFGGTGLGLALTRRLCTLLGGDVTVRSKVGAGSTFTIVLPRELAHGARPDVPDPNVASA